MKLDLSKYADKKICVAVSGGKDSMALLHYLFMHGEEYGITLSALNCDHGIRGERSKADSAFVREWCKEHNIPLLCFERKGKDSLSATEQNARLWRVFQCYPLAHSDSEKWTVADKPDIFSSDGKWRGADAVATAHHMNDNAETVLFNLARGSGLAGVAGIADNPGSFDRGVVHPLLSCTREEIEEYVTVNRIAFVEDESNFTDDYTRNKIRHKVLPELENAVPGATKAIYRFSRLAAEDEEYLSRQAKKLRVECPPYGDGVLFCAERVLFKRAVLDILYMHGVKDYTSEHMERLYALQFAEKGKKFEFLDFTAFREEGKIVLVQNVLLCWKNDGMPFKRAKAQTADNYLGQLFFVASENLDEDMPFVQDRQRGALKRLKFDLDAIPDGAVVRFMKEGDRFEKFGGGTKKLGDYFTDKKIPVRVRNNVPVVAAGNEILMVGGVEISDKVKVTEKTRNTAYLICADYCKA